MPLIQAQPQPLRMLFRQPAPRLPAQGIWYPDTQVDVPSRGHAAQPPASSEQCVSMLIRPDGCAAETLLVGNGRAAVGCPYS